MPPRSGETLLRVEGLHVAYGKAEVVHGASFEVRAGEFVVLLGRNGAGKSTTLHACAGLIPKKAGRVSFNGRDISGASAREIASLGLTQVLEGHRVFTTLSVEDNLLIGTYATRFRGDRARLEPIYALFPELGARRHELAARLSGGQQQILAVAQGVISEPRLLVLDEPSGGLAPLVVDRILDCAAQLCAQGVAILLVEQLVEKALARAHWCYVMETGRIAAGGPAEELAASEDLHSIYLGGGVAPAGANDKGGLHQ